jgi:hypothetical protein
MGDICVWIIEQQCRTLQKTWTVLGDQLLRPSVPPNTLTGVVYRRFLFNDLPVHLEDAPVHQRQHMRVMPDETSPASFSLHWPTARDPN